MNLILIDDQIVNLDHVQAAKLETDQDVTLYMTDRSRSFTGETAKLLWKALRNKTVATVVTTPASHG